MVGKTFLHLNSLAGSTSLRVTNTRPYRYSRSRSAGGVRFAAPGPPQDFLAAIPLSLPPRGDIAIDRICWLVSLLVRWFVRSLTSGSRCRSIAINVPSATGEMRE